MYSIFSTCTWTIVQLYMFNVHENMLNDVVYCSLFVLLHLYDKMKKESNLNFNKFINLCVVAEDLLIFFTFLFILSNLVEMFQLNTHPSRSFIDHRHEEEFLSVCLFVCLFCLEDIIMGNTTILFLLLLMLKCWISFFVI